MQGKIKEHLKVTVYLPFSFRKNLNKARYSIYGDLLPVLAPRATNSSTSTDPFSAGTKTLILGNLFKLVRFAITFARAVCHLG